MATQKYYVSQGKMAEKDVTTGVGAAITGGVVEVTVDLAVGATKREVLEGIDTIARRIRANDWPPA